MTMKFNVTVQYPYIRYFETTWTVEASDSEAAKLAAIYGECDGTFGWDASYGVGDGSAGPTEIMKVEPVAQPNRYTTEGGDRDDETLGDPDEYPPRCTHPGGHVWNRTPGEADEARLAGDYANDNVRCVYCGADGDA